MNERLKKIAARFYAAPGGRRPVGEWILDLQLQDPRLVGRDIQKVEFGWPLGMPYCRTLGQGLWEVRSDLTRGRIARVIFFIKDDEMVLLHAVEDSEDSGAGNRHSAQTQARGAMMQDKKGHIDRSETFDEFLAGQGILAETEEAALKQVIADQIKAAMELEGLSKTDMAARMNTSRRQLDRLLDPDYASVTLGTLRRAAAAVGRTLRVDLV